MPNDYKKLEFNRLLFSLDDQLRQLEFQGLNELQKKSLSHVIKQIVTEHFYRASKGGDHDETFLLDLGERNFSKLPSHNVYILDNEFYRDPDYKTLLRESIGSYLATEIEKINRDVDLGYFSGNIEAIASFLPSTLILDVFSNELEPLLNWNEEPATMENGYNSQPIGNPKIAGLGTLLPLSIMAIDKVEQQLAEDFTTGNKKSSRYSLLSLYQRNYRGLGYPVPSKKFERSNKKTPPIYTLLRALKYSKKLSVYPLHPDDKLKLNRLVSKQFAFVRENLAALALGEISTEFEELDWTILSYQEGINTQEEIHQLVSKSVLSFLKTSSDHQEPDHFLEPFTLSEVLDFSADTLGSVMRSSAGLYYPYDFARDWVTKDICIEMASTLESDFLSSQQRVRFNRDLYYGCSYLYPDTMMKKAVKILTKKLKYATDYQEFLATTEDYFQRVGGSKALDDHVPFFSLVETIKSHASLKDQTKKDFFEKLFSSRKADLPSLLKASSDGSWLKNRFPVGKKKTCSKYSIA